MIISMIGYKTLPDYLKITHDIIEYMKIMLWIGLFGAVLLLIPVVWLAARNWSPDVYKPLISIVIGGLAAIIIALLTILRDSEEQVRFVSSVVIDNRTHLPAAEFKGDLFQDDAASPENRIVSRHAILGKFGELTKNVISIKPDERKDAIAAEFLEYKLLHDIAISQAPEDSKAYIHRTDEHGIPRMAARIQKRILPPHAVKKERESLQSWLKNNRLFNAGAKMQLFSIHDMWMPKCARMTLSAQTVDTVSERLIQIEVPQVLTASFRIRCLGSPGFGILPPIVVVNETDLKHYETYGIDVTMKVHYSWMAAASPIMPAYKQWISFLFTRLEQLNSDDLTVTIKKH